MEAEIFSKTQQYAQTYPEPGRISKMELFMKIVNG